MLTVATIHDPLQILRACRDLSDLSTFSRHRFCEDEPELLLGLWLETREPARLRLAVPRDERWPSSTGGPAAIGSVGVSGVWTLTWLEGPWSHADLLDALVARARPGRYGVAAGQFVPVFLSSTADEIIEGDMARLRRQQPRLVSPPMLQDADTGHLALPTVQRWSPHAMTARP